jgi:hypothetical protein
LAAPISVCSRRRAGGSDGNLTLDAPCATNYRARSWGGIISEISVLSTEKLQFWFLIESAHTSHRRRAPSAILALPAGCFLAVLSQLTCWRRRSIFLVLATVVLQLLDLLVCSRCRPAHVPSQRPSRPATIGRRCFMEEFLRNGNRRKGRIGPRSKRHNALTDRVAITYAAAVLFPLTGR